MIELQGKYNKAKVFTENIEQQTISQIIDLCNQDFIKGSSVRIMPDCHSGKGCVIGTTITIKDKVVPNLVGVDIGCGMLCVELDNIELNLPAIDNFIRENIPHGFNIYEHSQTDYKEEISNLKCFRDIPKSAKEFNRALGTLGGGNHFIEINVDDDGNKYLVIHSGSRNLGHQVASYYQKRAGEYHNGLNDAYEDARVKMIAEYKTRGKRQELQKALFELKERYRRVSNINNELCYLEGKFMEDYLYDMKIMQRYAIINREIIGKKIIEECIGLKFNKLNKFQTIHNYINLDNMVLRKGSISAQKDEIVLIPINMRDGSLLCRGKGNPDWNYSAPHGAGRLMSRSKAKEMLNLDDFKKSMEGIYTTSVSESTLDEAAFAYKPIEDIVNNIQDTVEILKVIKPIYNFKSS